MATPASPRSIGISNRKTEPWPRLLRNRDIASHQARVFAADGQPQAGPPQPVKTAPDLAERLEQLLLAPRPKCPSRYPQRGPTAIADRSLFAPR